MGAKEANPLALLDRSRIDQVVSSVCLDLQARGFAAYLVGGAVRDLLRGESPTDWDVATSARPEEVMALFPDSLPPTGGQPVNWWNRYGVWIVSTLIGLLAAGGWWLTGGKHHRDGTLFR